MKIELAPWAESLTGNMETLYTELKMEKTENTLAGEKCTPISDYKELFQDIQPVLSKVSKPKQKRIIGSGDPGIGKTTFAKKAAWDWARGIFTTFSIVFFVSLKLVKLDDTIENIIIQQTPALEGLNVREEKLKQILDVFGSKILIIMDGYDEISSENKENKDLSKLFQGKKYPRCSILITSRPHSVSNIPGHFQFVVNIRGFTKELAHQFASDALIDPSQVDSVLQVECVNVRDNLRRGDTLYASPMLLLFLCILTNSGDIDPERKDITVGEIFWKLMQCIYKKYCVKKGIPYVQSEFLILLFKLSDVAYRITLEGNFLKRKEVIDFLGKDVFDYGFLIGHEDSRLLRRPNSDILIMYPHKSIEEFFFTFRIIVYMSNTKSWYVIPCDTPAFMISSLSLQFCLWFVHHGEAYFSQSINTRNIQKTMKSEILRLIDYIQVSFRDIGAFYRGVDLADAVRSRDNVTLNFFKEVCKSFRRVKHMTLPSIPEEIADWALDAFQPVLKQLATLTIQSLGYYARPPAYLNYLAEDNIKDFILIVHGFAGTIWRNIVKCRPLFTRHQCVYLSLDEENELSVLLDKDVMKLHLISCRPTTSVIKAQFVIQTCPFLSELSFKGTLKVDPEFWSVLSSAVRIGKLPVLQSLEFLGCGTLLKGNIPKLLHSKWPTLNHLNLDGCELNKEDIEYLSKNREHILPCLASLTLHFQKIISQSLKNLSPKSVMWFLAYQKGQMKTQEMVSLLFRSAWVSLTNLCLHDLTKEAYKTCTNALNTAFCPSLERLQFSMWPLAKFCQHVKYPLNMFVNNQGILKGWPIEWLDPVDVPSLTHLGLHGFICSVQHLYIVTKTPGLTKLNKLDIRDSSGISGTLSILLCHSFPALNILILSKCGLNCDDLRSLAKANIRGRLPQLTDLDISHNDQVIGQLECLFPNSCIWPKLCHLNIQQIEILNPESTMKISGFKLKPNQLPRLQELKCAVPDNQPVLPISCVGKWESLRVLTVDTMADNECFYLLCDLVKIVEQDCLPSLRDVRFVNFSKWVQGTEVHGFLMRQKLRRRKISVNYYLFLPEYDM